MPDPITEIQKTVQEDTLLENTPFYMYDPEIALSNTEVLDIAESRGVTLNEFVGDRIQAGARIIGFGERHNNEEVMQAFLGLVRSIHQGPIPIGTIVVEGPSYYEKYIANPSQLDPFLQTTNDQALLKAQFESFRADQTLLAPWEVQRLVEDPYFKILQTAKELGINVVGADNGEAEAKLDKNLHDRTQEIADARPETVTILYAGEAHVNDGSMRNNLAGVDYRKLNERNSGERYMNIGTYPFPQSESSTFTTGKILPRQNNSALNVTSMDFSINAGAKPSLEPTNVLGNFSAVYFMPQ